MLYAPPLLYRFGAKLIRIASSFHIYVFFCSPMRLIRGAYLIVVVGNIHMSRTSPARFLNLASTIVSNDLMSNDLCAQI